MTLSKKTKGNEFIAWLEENKVPVWKKMLKYLPNKNPRKYYKIVRDYPERQGKYLRPGLLLLSNALHGGRKEGAMLAAAAMQISEEWLLVHDDFLDHSDLRRKKSSLNKLYGDEIAVNAGDTLHVIMWEIIGDVIAGLGIKKGMAIHKKFSETLLATLEGQFTEVNWIKEKRLDITESEYFKMIDLKAGLYSFVCPLEIGAIIAGADKKTIKKIKSWGIFFGRAFQVWDDVMNLAAPSSSQGKERGGDILEGKRSLILVDLLKKCSAPEKEKIMMIYGKKRDEKTGAEKKYVLDLMDKYGSIEYARAKAKFFSKKSENIFNKETKNLKNAHAKKILREGMNFVANRIN